MQNEGQLAGHKLIWLTAWHICITISRVSSAANLHHFVTVFGAPYTILQLPTSCSLFHNPHLHTGKATVQEEMAICISDLGH